jgi:hypothetical protein
MSEDSARAAASSSGDSPRSRPRRAPALLRRVPGLGTVKVGRITLGDLIEAEQRRAAAAETDKDATYTNFLISQALIEPPQTPDDVAGYSDATLRRLASGIARATGLYTHYAATPTSMDPRSRFAEAHRRMWAEISRSVGLNMQNAMAGIRESIEAVSRSGFLSSVVRTRASLDPSLTRIQQTVHLLNSPPGGLQRTFDILRSLVVPAGLLKQLSESQARSIQPVAAFNRIPSSVFGSLPATVSALGGLKLPQGTLDRALIHSMVNSQLIHTPTYSPQVLRRRTPFPVNRVEAERLRLVDAYDILAKLEMTIRGVISERLREHAGDSWWRTRVPEAVRTACDTRKAEKEKVGGPNRPPLEYAYIDDYRAIVLRGDNWRDVFEKIFEQRVLAEACFLWCTRPRQDIAHVRALGNRAYNEFVWGARWLIAAVERAILRNRASDEEPSD